MSRGLCVLAALAVFAGGCASRQAVDRLGSDVGRLRKELAEMRVAQEATSRDLANVSSQIQSLDVRTLGDEVARLSRRADAADSALAATQTKVEALAPQPGSATSSGRPATSPVPALLPPNPAVLSPVPAPTPPAPAVMSPVPAPLPPASVSPPPAPAPPPPAAILPPPAAQPSPPAAERPRVVAPVPSPLPPTAAPAPNVARAPTPAPAPPSSATPARPAPKAGGNPEQEYAAALATFRSREHGQAVLDFIDFMAKYPKHPLAGNAQYWIGEAYWAQRDYRQALVEFEKVFEHGPGKAPDALLKIGLCYLRLSDVPRAQQAWQRVVNEYPKSESAAMARSLISTHSSARR
jgi:tol-pal system protein YbgF